MNASSISSGEYVRGDRSSTNPRPVIEFQTSTLSFASEGLASLSVIYDERVACAPPAAGVLAQRSTLDEIQDVTVDSILR